MYERIMNLRRTKGLTKQPKILLALGGWNHGSGKFSDMARNETKRATFIATTIIFLQKHQFDGLDIDWVENQETKTIFFDLLIIIGISWFT